MTIAIHGIAASPGIAIGRAKVYRNPLKLVERRRVVDVAAELMRLTSATEQAVTSLETLREEVSAKLGPEHAQIFEAHEMILQDPEFLERVKSQIESEFINAEVAVSDVANQLAQLFESLDNEYMRQRSADIRDVSNRLVAALMDVPYGLNLEDAGLGIVLVAEDLHPSDTVQLDMEKIRGFVTDNGGQTSHTAIMARARGIPAVVGLGSLYQTMVDGALLIVDGTSGRVFVDPTEDERELYEGQARAESNQQAEFEELLELSSTSKDGHCVELGANIGHPDEAVTAVLRGAEGVGLFRSEFLFMSRDSLPSEAEQFQAYKQTIEALAGRPLIIRTMDIGGDKSVDYLNLAKEENPFLGYRAIRISLHRPEMFKVQLRAILRASHYGSVKIMFPMIATVEEVQQAKRILDVVKQELRAENVPFDDGIQVGIMVEIPATAIAADILAPEVDFFSIGTNDLIQYTMAADRMNEQVSYLYQPLHPAILRLVKMVIDASHKLGKWTGMCGEMAGDRVAAPILIGMGIDELSMNAPSILAVRKLIRESTYLELQHLAQEALSQSSTAEVQKIVEAWNHQR